MIYLPSLWVQLTIRLFYIISAHDPSLVFSLDGRLSSDPGSAWEFGCESSRDVPITWDCSGRGQCSLNSYQLLVIRPVFRSLPPAVFSSSRFRFAWRNITLGTMLVALSGHSFARSSISCYHPHLFLVPPLPLYFPRPLARSLCFFLFSLISLVVIDIRSLVAFTREMQSADRVCCQG